MTYSNRVACRIKTLASCPISLKSLRELANFIRHYLVRPGKCPTLDRVKHLVVEQHNEPIAVEVWFTDIEFPQEVVQLGIVGVGKWIF